MKIATVLGTRPQFVKAAMVSQALARGNALLPRQLRIREIIVHTGQHFDPGMSEKFFLDLGLPRPDFQLDIHGLPHGAMTGRMLEGVEAVLAGQKPDAVLVYGDSDTTLAGALAAAKMGLPVIHVEAGMRSRNPGMAEEINRVLTDRISSLLVCPGEESAENLHAEGLIRDLADCLRFRPGETGADRPLARLDPASPVAVLAGDVMLDAVRHHADRAAPLSSLGPELAALASDPRGLALCTVHRAENTDDPEALRSILAALERIAPRCPVVLPLHPRTRKATMSLGLRPGSPDLHVLDEIGYFSVLGLLKACRLVLTDSGGLQKEAFYLGRPCITLRRETEWTDLVRLGANTLAGTGTESIVAAFEAHRNDIVPDASDLYGGGLASERIARTLFEVAHGPGPA